MEIKKGKIGVNTALIGFIVIVFSPTVRTFGSFTSNAAKQAGWLSPIVAGVIYIYFILKLNTLLVQHPGLSLLEIYEKIIGKILAKIIAFVYLTWLTISIGLNLRSYSHRISAVLYPNVVEELFIVILLFVIALFLVKPGLIIASRVYIVLAGITIVGSALLTTLMLPMVNVENLLPITYLDVIPMIKGSAIALSCWSYITPIFIYSDDIIGLRYFKKRGLTAIAYIAVTTTIILATLYGIAGSTILSRSSFPYLLVVEQIQLLNSLQGFDAILAFLWIFSDVALISFLILICLKLIKYIFNIKDASIYTYVFTVLCYYSAIGLAENSYELGNFSNNIATYVFIVLFVFIPILISWIYKIRTRAVKALMKSNNAKKQA
ncbi:spore germination protein [Alkalibaculum bacchi]|uniref:Spore germination protein n=1 Tax=Alkalibaculum bacchi TaxID=645887 RepID=A0A366IAJ7_9FIRM|nr:GerAB/ArcD/ProY family transporter [Alkalibaculum bacchi]RBP65893.1 spore germination protein [Alkalibaculum bacchi]